MVNIFSTFIVDIEREFRGHLPQKCINILATMAEQQQGFERAINDQMKIIETLRRAIILSAEADRQMLSVVKKYESDHNMDTDQVRNQEFKADD